MVALVVVRCVRLDNVVVESERMLIEKVLMLVCCVMLTHPLGKQISCRHRGLHGRNHEAASAAHVSLQCSHDVKSKLSNSCH